MNVCCWNRRDHQLSLRRGKNAARPVYKSQQIFFAPGIDFTGMVHARILAAVHASVVIHAFTTGIVRAGIIVIVHARTMAIVDACMTMLVHACLVVITKA